MSEKRGGLIGKRVVNTRAPHQAHELTELLTERGAEVVLYPAINIAPPLDTDPLDAALKQAADEGFDWLLFTSTNTVFIVLRRMEALGLTPDALDFGSTAAVGPTTAEAVEKQLGLKVDVLPEEYVAESLAGALKITKGTRVLLPQSAIARPTLREMLTEAGAEVTVVEAYRTVKGSGGDNLPSMLQNGEIDALTFTSGSTVDYFVERLEDHGLDSTVLIGIPAACIGPVTAEKAKEQWIDAYAVPDEYTLTAMVAKLDEYFTLLEEED